MNRESIYWDKGSSIYSVMSDHEWIVDNDTYDHILSSKYIYGR